MQNIYLDTVINRLEDEGCCVEREAERHITISKGKKTITVLKSNRLLPLDEVQKIFRSMGMEWRIG